MAMARANADKKSEEKRANGQTDSKRGNGQMKRQGGRHANDVTNATCAWQSSALRCNKNKGSSQAKAAGSRVETDSTARKDEARFGQGEEHATSHKRSTSILPGQAVLRKREPTRRVLIMVSLIVDRGEAACLGLRGCVCWRKTARSVLT